MSKAIPDSWLNYRPIGDRIPGTRFIAFKVPLLENINRSVHNKQLRLAPHSLLESVPNLGLIVDLTNTNRYYNPQSFTDKNVEHKKLMVPGRQTPSKELAQRFCKYVTSFLERNSDNDKLIGVHCTHGVNRTGYLICYFMITHMNMPPTPAMQTFADARGHKIERENYTQSLQLLTPNKQKLELPSPVPSCEQLGVVPYDDSRRSRPYDNQSTTQHHASTGQQQQWRCQPQEWRRHKLGERQDERWQGQSPPRYYASYRNNRHYDQPSGGWHSHQASRWRWLEEQTNATNSTNYINNYHRGSSSNNNYSRDDTKQNFQFRSCHNSNAFSNRGRSKRYQYFDNH